MKFHPFENQEESPPTQEFSFSSDFEIPFEDQEKSSSTQEFSFSSDFEIPFEQPIQQEDVEVGDIEVGDIEVEEEEEEEQGSSPQQPPPQNIRTRRRLDGRSFTISGTLVPSLSIDGEVDLPTLFQILNSLWPSVLHELQQSKTNPNNNNNEPLPRIANMNVKVGDTLNNLWLTSPGKRMQFPSFLNWTRIINETIQFIRENNRMKYIERGEDGSNIPVLINTFEIFVVPDPLHGGARKRRREDPESNDFFTWITGYKSAYPNECLLDCFLHTDTSGKTNKELRNAFFSFVSDLFPEFNYVNRPVDLTMDAILPFSIFFKKMITIYDIQGNNILLRVGEDMFQNTLSILFDKNHYMHIIKIHGIHFKCRKVISTPNQPHT